MTYFTKDTKVFDVMSDSSFEGFGNLIFPVNRNIPRNMTLENVGDIYIWYNHINPNKTVEIVNYMKNEVDKGNKIFDVILDTNPPDTYMEVLIIDYDDNIHVDIKYDGEKENLEHIKHNFPENLLKYAEVLGFNTIEYVMDKN